MTETVAALAARGSLWLGLVNLVSKGSQVVVTVALAAFLAPSELGLVTLAVSLVNIGQVVQSMGVYDVVARTRRDAREMAGTVLTLSVGAGLALAAAGVLAAGPISAALGAPEAAPLVRLAALSLPFTAAGGVQMGLMHRELDFRRRMLPDAGSAVAGACVTVTLAAAGLGPYSLAVGLLVTAVLQPALGAVAGGWVPARWDPGAAAEAVRWIGVVGPGAVVAILLANAHYPILGRVLGPAAVGLYSLAFRVAWAPYLMVAVVLGAVAFPVYNRLIRDGRRGELPGAVFGFTRAVLVTAGGMYLLAALLADRVTLLGDTWRPAAPVLVWLCGYGLGCCLMQTWGEAIRAAGRPGSYLGLQLAHLGLSLAALAVAAPHGPVTAAAAQAAVVAAVAPAGWLAMRAAGVAPSPRELGRALAAPLLAAAGCVPLGWALGAAPTAVRVLALLACYAGVIATVELVNRG